MLKVRLYGGLGNQLYQFGMALYIAHKQGIRRLVIIDSTGGYDAFRVNELGTIFDLTRSSITVEYGHSLFVSSRIPKSFSLDVLGIKTVNDANANILISDEDKRKCYYLDGYFQASFNQYIFDFVRSYYQNILRKTSLTDNETYLSNDSAVIHIRGGDFLISKNHTSLDVSYYQLAMKRLNCDFGIKVFYVVTDDKIFANRILVNISSSKYKVEIISGERSLLQDFFLLINSKFKILSNSTFSIWAGALSQSGMGATIAPMGLSIKINREFKLPNEIRIER